MNANEPIKENAPNSWAAMSNQRAKVRFETQEKGEEVALLLRAHAVTLIPWVFLFGIFLILPLILSNFDLNILQFLRPGSLQAGIFIYLFWYLATFGFAVWRFAQWYFNIYLVTNERVIDFDFIGLTYKSVSDAQLSKIQDVTSRMLGVFHVFFNYGDVFVQTAAAMREFEFHDVPKPDLVARVISEQVRLEEGEAPGEIR